MCIHSSTAFSLCVVLDSACEVLVVVVFLAKGVVNAFGHRNTLPRLIVLLRKNLAQTLSVFPVIRLGLPVFDQDAFAMLLAVKPRTCVLVPIRPTLRVKPDAG